MQFNVNASMILLHYIGDGGGGGWGGFNHFHTLQNLIFI